MYIAIGVVVGMKKDTRVSRLKVNKNLPIYRIYGIV